MHIVSASGDGEKPAAFHLKDSSLLIKWTPAEAAGLMSCRLAYLIEFLSLFIDVLTEGCL
jgi:hypothetical protein